MTTCANTKLAEIRIAGKTLYVPSAEICGRIVVVTDKWIRTAQVRDEDVLEGVIVEDPDAFITELGGAGCLQVCDRWSASQSIDCRAMKC